jgi:hypothetical protein
MTLYECNRAHGENLLCIFQKLKEYLMLHNAHVLDLEDLLINWNTDDINRALWLEKDYAEYAAEHQAITSVFYKDEIKL